jgi:hypothetical protein
MLAFWLGLLPYSVTSDVHTEAAMTKSKIDEILQQLHNYPDSGNVPVEVAAKHDNVSVRTVRRRYPMVQLSPARCGVSVGYLRHRGGRPTA